MSKNDPLGEALKAYFKNKKEQEVTVHSDICDDDVITVSHFVRTFDCMPTIEQTALSLCSGKVLDVGAGAGCHSSYLKSINIDSTPIDISKGSVLHMLNQGLEKAKCEAFADHQGKYDTILLLMNGIGLIGDLSNFPAFIKKCKDLGHPGAQILFDSSDLRYLYAGDQRTVTGDYYGHVQYQMEFEDHKTDWFQWLYLDIETLMRLCGENGVNCEILQMGENCDYLARITWN